MTRMTNQMLIQMYEDEAAELERAIALRENGWGVLTAEQRRIVAVANCLGFENCDDGPAMKPCRACRACRRDAKAGTMDAAQDKIAAYRDSAETYRALAAAEGGADG